MRHAHIVGWGSFLPQYALTNDQIAEIVDTNDEWIVTRTGIRERRIASPKETTATLGFKAATQALAVAGITPSQVDLIIVATSTPDHVFPSAACLVQDLLTIRPGERSGIPDEVRQTLTLTNGRGELQKVSKWADVPDSRFAAILAGLLQLVTRVELEQPAG